MLKSEKVCQGSTEGAGRLGGVAVQALGTAHEAEDRAQVAQGILGRGHKFCGALSGLMEHCVTAEGTSHEGKTVDSRWNC